MEKNLKEFLEELIQEVEKELDEATATGNVAGYNVPGAFSDGGRKDKKRKKKIATQFGMKIVGKMDEDLNEAKVKRPVNRWLELKNDETMHPHKKMAMGLKELKYQLRETEKFFNWYNKIKTMNELDSNQYWKRTNTHIYKIKERLINIAKTIQEIEK
tara:strand:- start:630 stop:1103 length:474 start_codon:yes stop_codon:yes gene_type:complete